MTTFLFVFLFLIVLITVFWVSEVRLLLFLILVEFSIFLGSLSILPEWGMGGEVVIIFILSGSVLSLLLLIVSSFARKFGIYSSEV